MVAPQLQNNSPQRFDYLKGVGSGGCSDFDAVIERNGNFLIIENKHPGERIPVGQLIALRASVRRGDTVLVVHGRPPDQIESFGPLDGEQVEADVLQLRAAVQVWWDGH